nr:MAG TPA: hypothetical protein [Caudoviricetes sp.]
MKEKRVSALNAEIAEKRRLMRAAYGKACITPTELAAEVGYSPHARFGDMWAQRNGIPPVQLGPRKRVYEIDLVAKAIVQARGMC